MSESTAVPEERKPPIRRQETAGSGTLSGFHPAGPFQQAGLSTAVAALITGRRYICFETAPAIFSTAAQRIREAVAQGRKGT